MLCSDILGFPNLLFENEVRFNALNLSNRKQKLFDLASMSEELELSKFELAEDYCIEYHRMNSLYVLYSLLGLPIFSTEKFWDLQPENAIFCILPLVEFYSQFQVCMVYTVCIACMVYIVYGQYVVYRVYRVYGVYNAWCLFCLWSVCGV